MSIGTLIEKTKLVLSNDISYVIFAITSHCNARCAHCFYWENIENASKRKLLSIDEIEKLSAGLGNLLLINLCGGEPYLRKDISEIARIFATNNKSKFITIPSNGYLTDQIVATVDRMLGENPDTFFRFGISIDGIGELHDEIRRVEGLYERATETIRGLAGLKKKHSNFYVVTSTVFSADTEHTIAATLDHIRSNLPVDHTAVTYIRGTPKEIGTKTVDLERYRSLIGELNEKSRVSRHPMSNVINAISLITADRIIEAESAAVRPFDCYSGRKLIVIDDEGLVKPCEILPETYGNIRDFNFDMTRMLGLEKNRKITQDIKEKKCNCTWECAIQSSLVFNPAEYAKVIMRAI